MENVKPMGHAEGLNKFPVFPFQTSYNPVPPKPDNRSRRRWLELQRVGNGEKTWEAQV